jgi:hypothetical protein
VTAIEVLSLQLLCSDPPAREGIVDLLGLKKEGAVMNVTASTSNLDFTWPIHLCSLRAAPFSF